MSQTLHDDIFLPSVSTTLFVHNTNHVKNFPFLLLLFDYTHNLFITYHPLKEVPYVMVKEDKNLTGNARFEGFCIDLLHGIAKQIGFQYTIKLVPDRMYGVFDPETKQWNGIVRELIERVNPKTMSIDFYFKNWRFYRELIWQSRL